MSSGLDIQLVREHYRKISGQELIYLATENASGLTPEAMEVVMEEIRQRNLNPNIEQGVEAQNRPVSREEILAYCEVIQNMPCPVCGSTERKINATLTGEVLSIVPTVLSTRSVPLSSISGIKAKITRKQPMAAIPRN